jgi:peptide/nickel transport system substrate-binding protein
MTPRGKFFDLFGGRTHAYIPELADQLATQKIDRREFLRTSTLLGLSAAAAYSMSASLTGEAHAQQAAPAARNGVFGGTLRVAKRVQEITDPAKFSTDAHNQTRHIVEYLTETGFDNITRPSLAERWEASEDLKTWTLHLRQNVLFNNGNPFEAADVEFNLRRWLKKELGSANASLFSALPATGIEVADTHTIKLHLSRAELAIPENFFAYTTAILHRSFDDTGSDFAKNPIGTGPYELVSNAYSDHCVLKKRKSGYWGQEPYLDEIVYIDTGDGEEAKIAALASDQVDAVHEISVEQIDLVKQIPTLKLYDIATSYTAVARMRVSEKPFDDLRVRRAVVLSLDHAKILEIAYRGYGTVGENHHVAPTHPEYYKLPPVTRDIPKAKALLAEAGHASGLTITIDYGQNEQWHGRAVQVMKEQLAEAGINLQLNTMPSASYWDIWKKTPFGFTSWSDRPLGVMTLKLAYRSGGAWNESNYQNPEFDAALDKALGILDPEKRRVEMQKVETILQDDAVIAQPLWRSVFSAASIKVHNYHIHPTLAHFYRDVWVQ